MAAHRPSWDTPPNGDFAAYVERLTAESAARTAAVAGVPVAAPAPPTGASSAPPRPAQPRARPQSAGTQDARAAAVQALAQNPSALLALRKLVRGLRQGALGLAVLFGVLWWWGGGLPVASVVFLALWWGLGLALQRLDGGMAGAVVPKSAAPRPARDRAS